MKKVYLDYAATTPVDERVFEAMRPYFCDCYGNANSIHSYGRAAADAVDGARRIIASALHVNRADIFFTSGGSEANSWAVKCARNGKRKRVLVSAVEHPSVLNAAADVGGETIPVDAFGRICEDSLINMLDDDVALVSVMLVNNELGTVHDIKRIADIVHRRGALMHTDAVQAFGITDVNIKDLGVDMLSLSAHKLYGPKGVGALYAGDHVDLTPLISGGHQERSMRGGTTNVPAVVGFGKAVEISMGDKQPASARFCQLKKRFVEKIKNDIPNIEINGDTDNCVPNIVNIRFDGIDGKKLVTMLDIAGIAASVGAACSAGSVETSYVLKALGLSEKQAESSVRFSLGKYTAAEDLDFAAEQLQQIVSKLRKEK